AFFRAIERSDGSAGTPCARQLFGVTRERHEYGAVDLKRTTEAGSTRGAEIDQTRSAPIDDFAQCARAERFGIGIEQAPRCFLPVRAGSVGEWEWNVLWLGDARH